jgi:protein gp37
VARNSKIEWTDHTFNPWWGCTKVSPACKHCYAEAWSKRVGSAIWGTRAPRRFFSDAHWDGPKSWNRDAKRSATRRRVFCASMADVFEDRRDLDEWRDKLFRLIGDTPWLDWLLLTKRPEKTSALVPWGSAWPTNVWLGTTVENQAWADRRLPELRAVPACIRFVSCEPLLGAIDLRSWLTNTIQWVIAGGESGPRARPTDPSWLRSIRDQCEAADVPFHFKQWGVWAPHAHASKVQKMVRGTTLYRVNKAVAGRVLDGRTWDERPG